MGFKDVKSPGHKFSLSSSLYEKNVSSPKTRGEVKLSINYSTYLKSSYTFT